MSQQLRSLFMIKASRWGERHPGEEKKLAERILYWASFVSASGEPGDVSELVVDQIQHTAQRGGISPERVVEQMFKVLTADDVMLIFQLGLA